MGVQEKFYFFYKLATVQNKMKKSTVNICMNINN